MKTLVFDSSRFHSISRLLIIIVTAINVHATESPKKFPVPQIPYQPEHYLCYRSLNPIAVDGNLTEQEWSSSQWTSDFVDIEGSAKPAPRFKTSVKMLWDDEYFYIAAWMQEPHLWATYDKRDMVIFHENDFEVFIDPDGDTHQYYEFEMNALNTVWDLLLVKPYRDGAPAVNAWDIAGLKTAVKLYGTLNRNVDSDSAWTLEIAFPWKVLCECANRDTPPKDGDQWKVNFSRVEWKTTPSSDGYKKEIDPITGKTYPEDNWVWSPQGLINMHYPEMWGVVQFSSIPVGTASAEYHPDPDEDIRSSLRQIYYWQKDRQEFSKSFSDELSLFKMELQKKVRLQTTSSGFEAVAPSHDGNANWHIDESGRIWKTIGR